MRAILRWFVLSVVIFGASCARSVRQEQYGLAVTVGTGPAVAEALVHGLLPALAGGSSGSFQSEMAVDREPLVASAHWLADATLLDEGPPQPSSVTRDTHYASCATSLDSEQATARLVRAAPRVVEGDALWQVTGKGPVLVPANEGEDDTPGLGYGWLGPMEVLPGGDGPSGPPTAPFGDRRQVSEVWTAGRYPLLVEDTDRYWLVGTAARQLARPDTGLARLEVSSSGSLPDVPAQPVTRPGEAAPPVANERRLLVDQGAQVMYVYEGGVEVRALPISTGMPTSKTLTRAWLGLVGQDLGAATVDGGMRVEQAWYLFPDLFGNILLHTVPYVEQGTLRLYDQPEALGVRPSSHGCVRISVQDAQWLKEWGPVGVPIEITAPPGPIRQVG